MPRCLNDLRLSIACYLCRGLSIRSSCAWSEVLNGRCRYWRFVILVNYWLLLKFWIDRFFYTFSAFRICLLYVYPRSIPSLIGFFLYLSRMNIDIIVFLYIFLLLQLSLALDFNNHFITTLSFRSLRDCTLLAWNWLIDELIDYLCGRFWSWTCSQYVRVSWDKMVR